jgi:hypothetical protein
MKVHLLVLLLIFFGVFGIDPKKSMNGVKDLEGSSKFINFVQNETSQKKFVLAFMYGKSNLNLKKKQIGVGIAIKYFNFNF